MSRLPRPLTTHGNPRDVLGPNTALARVFALCEAAGHDDPAGSWQRLTRAWNWAAPLGIAVPRVDVPGPAVRQVPGGFALSGQWRLPARGGTGPWLALPFLTARTDAPDLFVVSSKVLPTAANSPGGAADPGFRLRDVYVPGGFVTHTSAMPLRASDGPFLWTAVTGLALGAARRMTEALPAPAAADPAAVLHDERLSLAAALHGGPSARQGLSVEAGKHLAARSEQAGNAVHQVVAATYAHVLADAAGDRGDPLTRLIDAASPILQQVRFARDLLPLDGGASSRKGRTR